MDELANKQAQEGPADSCYGEGDWISVGEISHGSGLDEALGKL